MARKTQQQNPLDTVEDVEREITRRIDAQMQLFGKPPTAEEADGIRAEVENLYSAEQDMGREIARNEEAREPVPYVTSYEAAADLFTDQGGLSTIDDYVKLDDKEALIGKPFIIMQWWFSEGDIGEYATMKIITRDAVRGVEGDERRKFTVTDGSTGICAQLREITNRTGKHGGLQCREGLRVSTYTYMGAPAATFYLT